MAHYIAFDNVMEEMNGEDSGCNWCDSGDNLVPDSRMDIFQSSKHHQAEDPLDRIEVCQEDTILEEAE